MIRASLGVVSLFVITLFAACDDSSGQDESISTIEQETSQQDAKAKLQLKSVSSTVAQTSQTGWTLAKTGSLDEPSSTVTWVVTAAPGGTSRRLVVNGKLTVKNTGNGPATIGNLIVNLQTKPTNKWQTVSSDVVNATIGDSATKALAIRKGADDDDDSNQVDDEDNNTNGNWVVTTFTENAASGSLSVANATTNAALLPPNATIAAGATLSLKFTATYNNDVLGLAVGKKIRAQVLVTFGKAGNGNHTVANVDINGSGSIDAFEARVRTVGARLGQKTVPAATSTSTPVTLTDTLADIGTTGTVTFTHPVFNIGATSGTVQVTVDGGDAGGTIKNCAHLTGSGIALEACNAQTIAANEFMWQDGDVITHSQTTWGDTPSVGSPAALLLASYNVVYASTFGMMEVGVSGTTGFSMTFSNPNDLLTYLPGTGPYGPLANDYSNPTATESGAFGGEVAALRINIDFSDAGLTLGASGVPFGNVTLCNFTAQPLLNGLTVRQFLGAANTLLGGGIGSYSIAELAPITNELNRSFANGVVFPFADDHLVIGACP